MANETAALSREIDAVLSALRAAHAVVFGLQEGAGESRSRSELAASAAAVMALVMDRLRVLRNTLEGDAEPPGSRSGRMARRVGRRR